MSIWQISEDGGCVTGEGISNKRDKIAKDSDFEKIIKMHNIVIGHWLQ